MREADIYSVAEFEALVDKRMSELGATSVKLMAVLFMREGQSLTDKEILIASPVPGTPGPLPIWRICKAQKGHPAAASCA